MESKSRRTTATFEWSILGGVEARKPERLWICTKKGIESVGNRERKNNDDIHPSSEEVEKQASLERVLDEAERETPLPDQRYRVLVVESCELVSGLENHAVGDARMGKAWRERRREDGE